MSFMFPMSLCPAGSNYKDDSLNLMPFFTASCYSGYGDDSKVCLHERRYVARAYVISSELGIHYVGK